MVFRLSLHEQGDGGVDPGCVLLSLREEVGLAELAGVEEGWGQWPAAQIPQRVTSEGGPKVARPLSVFPFFLIPPPAPCTPTHNFIL